MHFLAAATNKACTSVAQCWEEGEYWQAFSRVAIPLGITILILYIIYVVASWFIFEKAKVRGWKALVPVYNYYMMFQIVEINKWFSLLMLVPIVNFGIAYWMYIRLAEAFGQKDWWFAAGLFFLNPVFMMMLAFDKKYEYQYAKGRQMPFKDAFRPTQRKTFTPESNPVIHATPPQATNDASVTQPTIAPATPQPPVGPSSTPTV